jgi:hypothetical protein
MDSEDGLLNGVQNPKMTFSESSESFGKLSESSETISETISESSNNVLNYV